MACDEKKGVEIGHCGVVEEFVEEGKRRENMKQQ